MKKFRSLVTYAFLFVLSFSFLLVYLNKSDDELIENKVEDSNILSITNTGSIKIYSRCNCRPYLNVNKLKSNRREFYFVNENKKFNLFLG